MTQPEARLSRAIRVAIKDKGHFAFKVHGSVHMMAGLPDLICCCDGLFFGLEVKTPENRDNVSARQALVHGMIRNAGGQVAVICSVQEALDFIEHPFDPRSKG